MQQSSPNVTNDFCSIDSETKEEIVTSLRNIYSDLTKGSNFTCTNHHDGCPAKHGNEENDACQYLYVGNEVFLYNCRCDSGGIKKDGKFKLQTLNGEEAIPVGMMRNCVKPTTVMTLKPEVGPSGGGNLCPCARCHQVSSIGCCCKGCMVEDDYLACSTQRYYQSEGLSVKISNASCCFCNRGKQTLEENAAPLEGRKYDSEQVSDLILKLNDIEKKINLTNMNVGNITQDNDYFSTLLNELSQLIYSFKDGDRNLINTIEALKLKLMSLEKGLKCVFKDSECFQEVSQEKQHSYSSLSLRDETDFQKEYSPMAGRHSGISRKADAETETETSSEAEKPTDIVRHNDVHTESFSEAVTPAEISGEFDSRIESISEAGTPAEISHEFDARTGSIREAIKPAVSERQIGTQTESSRGPDRKSRTPSGSSHRDAKGVAKIKDLQADKTTEKNKTDTSAGHIHIVPHYDAPDNIRETATPEISHQFDARTGSIREAIKPAVSEFGMQTERSRQKGDTIPSRSSHRGDANIKSSDNKVSERNALQADGNTINKTTENNKTYTSAEHIHQIKEPLINGLKTGATTKLRTEHQKKVARTSDNGVQTDDSEETEAMGKVFKRDETADGIPQTDIDTSGADTSAERKFKFDIEAESCGQDDDNYPNLTDNIQINGEKECCFKVKIKKIKILGETSNFKEYNKIKDKSVDIVESLNDSNKTKQAKEEKPISSLNKVSEEPTIFSELAKAGKSTSEKSVSFADSNGIQMHKKTGQSSKKKMAKSLGRPKENGKELQSKQKFEIEKKKKKHLSTNEGKYNLQKRGSLLAKQNELSMNAIKKKYLSTNEGKYNLQKRGSLVAKQNELSMDAIKKKKVKHLSTNGSKYNLQKRGSLVAKQNELSMDAIEKKKEKHLSTNGSKYNLQKSGSLVAKQNELSMDAIKKKKEKHLSSNGSKYNFQKRGSLVAKQNELSMDAIEKKKEKHLSTNGSKYNLQKSGSLVAKQNELSMDAIKKKKEKHLSSNGSKYNFQKRGSLVAKQNELSMNAKGNNENGMINAPKLPPSHSKKTKLSKGNRENNLTKSRIIEKKGSKIESLKIGHLDSSDPKEYVQQNSKASARRKSTLNLDVVRETQQNDLLNRRIYWENKHFRRTSELNYYDSSNRDCNQSELFNQQDYCEIKNIEEKNIPNYCDSIRVNNKENKLMNKQICCEIKNVKETSKLSASTYCNQDSEAIECKDSPAAVTFWRKNNEGNGLSCCSKVHPCCDCSLGEGHHCHINQEKIFKDEIDDYLEAELEKLPAWCRNNYIPDICTQTDVTKEIFIGQSKKKCCYPAPCPAACINHLPKEEWLDVMPPRLYAMQPRKRYPC